MSKHFISKDKLSSISYDDKTGILQFNWDTGGEENAVCGLKLKVELVDKIISTYKSPNIPYDSNYREAF